VTISNSAGWITREGSDNEDDESARERTLRSWSELALVPLRDTYINVCSAIAGVLYVTVKDQHPRGQGTVDIIITSEAGTATEDLLEKCRVACEEIREPDTDVKVKRARSSPRMWLSRSPSPAPSARTASRSACRRPSRTC